ncbi:hypothetical protein [Vreelandella sp. EE22]
MPSTPAIVSIPPARRTRRCGLARWWLAGLLVSCLLPVSLSPSESSRVGERAVSICLWVPVMLRAQSRCTAIKRRGRHLPRHVKAPAVRLLKRLFDMPFVTPPKVAAQDVLTSRGPPGQ